MEFITRTGTQSKVYNLNPILTSMPYLTWLESSIPHLLAKDIYAAYINYKVNPKYFSNWIRFDMNRTSGAFSIINKEIDYDLKDLTFMQIYISEKLKLQNYITNLSEEKINKPEELSLIIYQKPSYKLPPIEDKSDQVFGNIHTEIKTRNKELIFFKMIVHRYNDFRFDQGKPFEELMATLFKY
jgi:hypothetical protein